MIIFGIFFLKQPAYYSLNDLNKLLLKKKKDKNLQIFIVIVAIYWQICLVILYFSMVKKFTNAFRSKQ